MIFAIVNTDNSTRVLSINTSFALFLTGTCRCQLRVGAVAPANAGQANRCVRSVRDLCCSGCGVPGLAFFFFCLPLICVRLYIPLGSEVGGGQHADYVAPISTALT